MEIITTDGMIIDMNSDNPKKFDMEIVDMKLDTTHIEIKEDTLKDVIIEKSINLNPPTEAKPLPNTLVKTLFSEYLDESLNQAEPTPTISTSFKLEKKPPPNYNPFAPSSQVTSHFVPMIPAFKFGQTPSYSSAPRHTPLSYISKEPFEIKQFLTAPQTKTSSTIIISMTLNISVFESCCA